MHPGCQFRIGCMCGWGGPFRKTKRSAILAWNRVMRLHIDFADLEDAVAVGCDWGQLKDMLKWMKRK
jgi:hypothetical protein